MTFLEKKVHYFLTVVEEGSFSAAARKLYVSQANLSKQIVILEKEVGTELFDRTGYRPVLTDAGKFLYDRLTKIRRKEDEINEGLSKFIPGNIRMGFTGVSENRELIEAIRIFQTEHPGNEVELKKYDLEGCAAALVSDLVDISFGLEVIFKKYKGIKYEILHGYDICFVCTKTHPLANLKSVTVEQVKNEELIVLSKKFSVDYYNNFMESCRKDGYRPNVKKEVDDFDELIMSLCIGEGVALCGESSVKNEGLVTVPLVGTFHSPNYVVAYKDNEQKSNVELLLRYIRDYFKTL